MCRLGGLYYLLKAATLAWLVLPQTKVRTTALIAPLLLEDMVECTQLQL